MDFVVVALWKIKFPVAVSSHDHKLLAGLSENEGSVAQVSSNIDNLRDERNRSTQKFKSCFSAPVKVRVLSFISTPFYNLSSKDWRGYFLNMDLRLENNAVKRKKKNQTEQNKTE